MVSIDRQITRSLSWPGVEVLQLKRGFKIMLARNLSDNLKNGNVVFTGVRGDNLFIFFEGVGVVDIAQQTRIKRNLTGQK